MNKYITIEMLQEYAKNKGGKLLSSLYILPKTKMLWQCILGHKWEASWNDVKYKNTWCPECNNIERKFRNKIDINTIRQFAIKQGGKLISTEYINCRTHLIWECQKLHQWEAIWSSVFSKGSWCPICAHELRNTEERTDIKILQEYAKIKEGKLISENYVNNRTNLIWECKKGHQWQANWSHIKCGNTWCPECSSCKTEILCKQLLEKRLHFKFNKIKFYYHDSQFEWDGYNEEHEIAFEYHGYQHYIFPNTFHKTEDDFMKQKLRDGIKEYYAKENNIILLIIPYTEQNNLNNYINKLISEVLCNVVF